MNDYTFYFGTYNQRFNLSRDHPWAQLPPSADDIPAGAINLYPWRLSHVKSFQESVQGQTTTIGIPNKPSECAYVYDLGGPIRTFTIQGVRYDSEEEVSNLDFIHNQFNRVTLSEVSQVGRTGTEPEYVYSVGIEWLTSTMQSIMKGYLFQILSSSHISDGRMPVGPLKTSNLYGQEFNVGIQGFNYSFEGGNPGVMDYTLTLTERKKYGNSIYKEYVSGYNIQQPGEF